MSLRALGGTSSAICIQHRDVPINHRGRATVRVTVLDVDGHAVTGSLIRYFLVEEDGLYRVEMMEYLEAPLPTSEVERILH